jgi:hypothetical protein
MASLPVIKCLFKIKYRLSIFYIFYGFQGYPQTASTMDYITPLHKNKAQFFQIADIFHKKLFLSRTCRLPLYICPPVCYTPQKQQLAGSKKSRSHERPNMNNIS